MRKRLKKQYNTGGNTGIGADLGAGLLQGVGMGSQFGLPGAILGGVGGAFLGANQGIINRNNMIGYEDERMLREEKIAADEARLAAAQNSAILEQYPVEGTTTPRFADGGPTGGDGVPQVGPAPNGRRWNLRDLFLALPQAQKLLFDEDIQKAYGSMSDEEVQALIGTAVPMIEDIRGAESLGDKIGVVKDADLSWVKPLREKAGLSKNQMIDKAAEAGMLKNWAKLPVKGAAAFMDFEHGGDTIGGSAMAHDTRPTYYNDPQPNMPMGRALRYERGMPYYAPVDSPNGSIRQWDPSIMERIGEAFQGTFNPLSAIGYGVDNSEMEDSISSSMRADAVDQTAKMLTQDKNDILPDWVYGMFGVKPKMANGGPTGPEDSLLEDYVELLGPLAGPMGMQFAADDAYRAYQNMATNPGGIGFNKQTLDNAVDLSGAMPMLPGGSMLMKGAGMAKNIYDFVSDRGIFANGGQTLGPQYEAEGGEMIQYKGGDKPRVYGKGGLSQKAANEFEIKGPSHANGGVDMSDEKGARIYSDKLTVDSALAAKLMKL